MKRVNGKRLTIYTAKRKPENLQSFPEIYTSSENLHLMFDLLDDIITILANDWVQMPPMHPKIWGRFHRLKNLECNSDHNLII